MKNNVSIFLILNFFIGFISDIILNLLTQKNIELLKSLKPYFDNKSVMKAAIYAGITVVIIAGIIICIFKSITCKYLPEDINGHIYFLLISFLVGYYGDIYISKIKIFPKLEEYYQEFGEGFWGAIAILFSVICSLFGVSIL